MIEQIKKLEQEAGRLHLSQSERTALTDKAVQYGQNFLNALPRKKAFNEEKQMGKGIRDYEFKEDPESIEKLLKALKENVDTPGLNPASGGHMGYIPGGGVYPSALGDFLAAVTNRYAGVFFSSPGAVHMENMCIRWMCDLIGYGEKSGGNLTSGGSIANLTGLVAARDQANLDAKDFHNATIYTTQQVHHCVIKAIRFAGLKDVKFRKIEMDSRFRMNP